MISQNALAHAVVSAPVMPSVRISPDTPPIGSQSNTSGRVILKSFAASSSQRASISASSTVTACEKKYSPTRSPAFSAPCAFSRKRSSSVMPPSV